MERGRMDNIIASGTEVQTNASNECIQSAKGRHTDPGDASVTTYMPFGNQDTIFMVVLVRPTNGEKPTPISQADREDLVVNVLLVTSSPQVTTSPCPVVYKSGMCLQSCWFGAFLPRDCCSNPANVFPLAWR